MDRQSPLWDFAHAPPHSAPGVVSMVGYRGLRVPEGPHRGLPSSTLTFIVSLDAGVEAADSEEALAHARPNPLVLGGLHVRASHVRQRPGQAGVQLAMHPLASRALFGVPSSELDVTDFEGGDLLGRRALELHERLAATGDWREAFALVSSYLIGRHGDRGGAGPRPEVAHAWHLLERARGRACVDSVARAVGVSPRHLGTLFHRELGRSPKTVAMLMRFEHARALIADDVRSRGRTDLANVAVEAGFSDQAHLSREFVRFAGIAPRGWLAEEFRNIQDGAHADFPD